MTIRTLSRSGDAWSTVRDALLVKMQVPLADLDYLGHPTVDQHNRLSLRAASHQSLGLAQEKITEIGDWYYRAIGAPLPEGSKGKDLMLNRLLLGNHFRTIVRQRNEPVRIALSGAIGDFPGILADTLNKAMLTQYVAARRTWRAWAKRILVPDYKENSAIRLQDIDQLEKYLPGDEYKYAALREAGRERFALAQYTSSAKITRQAILSDDMELFSEVANGFASAAWRTEDFLAYAELEANPTMADQQSLFATAHQNITTGALTAATLGAGRALLARQTTFGGKTLDIVAARLIVPPELAGTAEGVLADAVRTRRALDEDPIELVESAFLTDTDQWYLAGDPRFQPAFAMGFLENEPDPVIITETDFDGDTMKLKCRHSVVANAIDPRAIMRSSGE